MAYDSELVYQRVVADGLLRQRVASLIAKFADYTVNNAGATSEQKTWANYVLSDDTIPLQKAAHMMWRVCWNAGVKDTDTNAVDDATLSAIIEPVAFTY